MIQFRPFVVEDFETLISWIDSEKTLLQFSGPVFKYPLTTDQLSLNISEANRYAYSVTETVSCKMIAYAELFITRENISHISRIIIGDPKLRGQGIGSQIIRQLLYHSFEVFGTEMATLYVFDWNTPAIKCYEKAGFVHDPDKTMKMEFQGEQWLVLHMSIKKTFVNHPIL
jgi:RimJ/RimL family protein N-acetyltransferase